MKEGRLSVRLTGCGGRAGWAIASVSTIITLGEVLARQTGDWVAILSLEVI